LNNDFSEIKGEQHKTDLLYIEILRLLLYYAALEAIETDIYNIFSGASLMYSIVVARFERERDKMGKLFDGLSLH